MKLEHAPITVGDTWLTKRIECQRCTGPWPCASYEKEAAR